MARDIPGIPAKIASPANLDIAVVLPTFNERDNIPEVIRRLRDVLSGLNWELIFVDDDSPDGTSELIRSIAAADRRIRLIQRIGRRGLSSACIEGMLTTSANAIAVMDADLQHDESILPQMLEKLRIEALDVVVGTRNSHGGSMGQFCSKRVWLSRVGQKISRAVSRCALTDPMSGFFLVRRSFLQEVVHRLHGGGFKILLDLLATSQRPVRVGEMGYCFRTRRFGASKLDLRVGLDYLYMVVEKLSRGFVSARLAAFLLVGTAGLLVHFAILAALYGGMHLSFGPSQASATVAAMIANFFLNNLTTYRDGSLHGIHALAGLPTYCAGCAFGACVNVSFADTLLRSGSSWIVAAFAGTVLSAGWNYAISSLFTWKTPHPRPPEQAEAFGGTLELR